MSRRSNRDGGPAARPPSPGRRGPRSRCVTCCGQGRPGWSPGLLGVAVRHAGPGARTPEPDGCAAPCRAPRSYRPTVGAPGPPCRAVGKLPDLAGALLVGGDDDARGDVAQLAVVAL